MSEKVFYNGSWHDLSRVTYSMIPVGMVCHFMRSTAPAGFLVCDGTSVNRAAYPDLADAMGVPSSAVTFQLPNLIGRFVEGATVAGVIKEAGLPNIEGSFGNADEGDSGTERICHSAMSGAFTTEANGPYTGADAQAYPDRYKIVFRASLYNSIYGNSTTVQPPSVTALPCIKAYDAVVDASLLQASEVINEIESKVALDGSNVSGMSQTLTTAIAHMGMPSDRYIDYAVGENGSEYIAPNDGWFYVYIGVGSGNSRIVIGTTTLRMIVKSYNDGNYSEGYIPIKKGDVCYLYYANRVVTQADKLRFIYAEGAY